MSGMVAQHDKDPGVRLLSQVAVTLFLWVATFLVATSRLAREGHSLTVRVLLVALAVAGFLSWVYVAGKSIFAQDEFNQRVHLVAIAVAFALTAVASFACDLLRRAGLVEGVSLGGAWMFMVLAWGASLIGTSRYYR